MLEVARGLKTLEDSFDVILTSPYARALLTAEILAEVYDSPKLFETAHLAADAVQEAFVSLWLLGELYAPERGGYGALLHTLVHRRAVDILRSRGVGPRTVPLDDEITTMDNSLTRPWSVVKSYRRDKEVIWVDNTCTEANPYVTIEGQTYFLSAEGKLMPLRKDQPPPDLKYFNQAKK